MNKMTCVRCDGSGKAGQAVCSGCRGKGKVTLQEFLNNIGYSTVKSEGVSTLSRQAGFLP